MKVYINWRYQESHVVDSEDIKKAMDRLNKLGADTPTLKTASREWLKPGYHCRLDQKGAWQTLYVTEVTKKDLLCYSLRCNIYKKAKDVQQVHEKVTPNDCNKEIRDLFKKHNGCGMVKAFGRVDSRDYKVLVPKPLYYLINDNKMFYRDLDNVQYIDVSSMFPGNARGNLPDVHTAVTVNGYVKPSEEFPFAFYLKSHHCAEYKTFDTHDYLKLPKEHYFRQCFTDNKHPIYNNVPDSEEVTVLMKPSKYQMTQVFEEIYKRKLNGDALAKAISVIGIGTLHRNPEHYHSKWLMDYYHIAAVILGRSNAQQYKMIQKIRREGGVLLEGVVDSLIYLGDKNYGIEEKVLGTYYNEFHKTVHCRLTKDINKYVVYDDKGILKAVVSGIDGDQVKISQPEDIDKYVKENK